MFIGIAPIEPNERGITSSRLINAKIRHDRWENPLKLALHYRDLMAQGKTKTEIARMVGVSRPRVTQVTNLLNLHPAIQDYLNKVEHNLGAKLLTERGLREIAVIQDKDKQLRTFRELMS